ncbi:MAG: lysophospholipid acyltransferase family protein [Candidatus Omnitrophica bacterium]|nr:lysophospholipid acyltransferase family protein [Candidatus Omnitrophota bacterium]MDD5237113.1 lysophospholipid acyltransferase family protein [Candidatus Omnitrophota bacterium]MDD5610153.1 lysophospholipid acyltransferase family protein [Candidatus Omnitrophota bacterium]
MLYRTARFIFWVILKLFFHFKVEGRDNLPKKGGFILASNHASFIDPVALGCGTGRRLNFFARHDLFKNPLWGRILLSVGAFPVVRDKADKAALKEALKRLGSGGPLVVFPEGTRSEVPGELLQPHAGIGFLALKSGVPVIPAFVSGTQNAWPKGSNRIKIAPISVRYGQPILLERGLPYAEAANKIMAKISELSCS